MKLKKNQIVENILKLGSLNQKATTITCRVIEPNLSRIGEPCMARICDARETRDDEWLIANNRTWAAPFSNLWYVADDKGADLISHKNGLVTFSGAV